MLRLPTWYVVAAAGVLTRFGRGDSPRIRQHKQSSWRSFDLNSGQASVTGPPTLFRDVKCFRCKTCADVKSLWYRGANNRQWHDVFAGYNALIEDPLRKLDLVDCTPDMRERFVVVQSMSNFADFESWIRMMPTQLNVYLKAVVFDQPLDVAFPRIREATTWTRRLVESKHRKNKLDVVFTGMDTARTDGGRMFRYVNQLLTQVIEDRMSYGRGEKSRAEESEDGAGGKRFVVLIKRPKQWRHWFMARLFDAGVWDQVDYTSSIFPTMCSYFHPVGNCEDIKGTERYRARGFIKAVRPRLLDGTDQHGSEFTNLVLEPVGRIHVVLESEAASFENPFYPRPEVQRFNCLWEERLTEKTFDAIAYGHPFMLVGTNNALDLVKVHGFKTFGSCINETYAHIEGPNPRMLAVVREVKRLHDLDTEEYNRLYTTCLKPIADYNQRKLLDEIKDKQIEQRLYAWGMQDEPAYDLKNKFHPLCDRAARHLGMNLTICRQ